MENNFRKSLRQDQPTTRDRLTRAHSHNQTIYAYTKQGERMKPLIIASKSTLEDNHDMTFNLTITVPKGRRITTSTTDKVIRIIEDAQQLHLERTQRDLSTS